MKTLVQSLLVIITLLLVGCGVADGGRVTASDLLKQNPDADIFQFEGRIFSNVTELEWVKQKTSSFTKYDLLGEIKYQSTKRFGFKDLQATKLPVGTKFYSTSEEGYGGFLIVELDGEEYFYLEMLEG